MSRDFRILVLGDSNAGKSSLINTFLKDVPLVPEASTSTDQHAANRCLPVVSAAALNGGTLYLVDSPSAAGRSKGSHVQLTAWHERQIDRADAVVVVCSMEDGSDIHSQIQPWIETVTRYAETSRRRKSRYLPLVLAATKSDLLEGGSNTFDQADIRFRNWKPLWRAQPEKMPTLLKNYSFWSAQQAIEYPLYPLYDTSAQNLRHPAEQVFNRIYRLLARQRKTIYPSDLQELQYRVFYQHITAAEVDTLLSNITHRPADGSGEIHNSAPALSQDDFQAFIRAFLECGRVEPVWRILQCYGYNTQLRLASSHLRPNVALSTDGNDCVELSMAGIAFLETLWHDFEKHPSSDTVTLDHYFALAGVGSDLAERFTSCIAFEDFIGQWQALAATEPSQVYESLALLDYPQSAPLEEIKPPKKGQQAYLSVVGATRILRKHASNRKVFTALVFGDASSRETLISIKGSVMSLGEDRHIALLNVPDLTQLSTKRVGQADLAIYVYSHTMDHHTSSSIDHLVSIRESAPQKVLDIPSRVVGVVPQTIELHDSGNTISALLPTVEATDFCAASGLGGPTIVDSVETLREEVLKCLRARQRSTDRISGTANWLLWSSALIAGMAASFVLLQRSGWLQVAQRYWHGKT